MSNSTMWVSAISRMGILQRAREACINLKNDSKVRVETVETKQLEANYQNKLKFT